MALKPPGLLALVLILAVGVAGCAVSRPTTTASAAGGPSPTLAPLVFYEEGSLVFLGVNVNLATFSLDDELIPVEIAIANKGLQKLTVTPEGITLRSLEGRAWPAATPKESSGSSLRSSFDRKRMPVAFEDLVRHRFSEYRFVPASSGFRRGNRSMSRTAEMSRLTWTLYQVWFPNPGGELKGKEFEVWLDARELGDPVFVTIRF